MAPLKNETCPFCNPGVNSIRTVLTYRTFPSWRLASPFEITSGNIGMTCWGRYTLVARRRASASSGPPGLAKCPTSAMWTVSTQCFVFGSISTETASSKSRASTGSMVMTRSPVKSVRPPRSASLKSRAACLASSSAAAGNSSGSPNALMTVRVSTPGSPWAPRTSVMTPSPRSSGLGKRTISMTT